MKPVRAAVAQIAPALLDRAACLAKVCDSIAAAAAGGARVVAFPETIVPGYPAWIDAGAFGRWDLRAAEDVHARLLDQAVAVPSAATERIGAAARSAGAVAVVGVHERSGNSLYNALLVFGEDGALALHRRKLVPTFTERLVWTPGDAHDLGPHQASFGKVGGLVCWEHWMPLPRQVLHDRGEEIHVAEWPAARELYSLCARHYAFEGRCFVLSAACVLQKRDFPPDFPFAALWPDAGELLLDGGSAIFGPDGTVLAGPVYGAETILYADLDPAAIGRAALTLDTAGHYARPDLFRVSVDERRPPERTSGST